jgi:hypothetical protein
LTCAKKTNDCPQAAFKCVAAKRAIIYLFCADHVLSPAPQTVAEQRQTAAKCVFLYAFCRFLEGAAPLEPLPAKGSGGTLKNSPF